MVIDTVTFAKYCNKSGKLFFAIPTISPFHKNFIAIRIIFICAVIYQKHKGYDGRLDIREARAIIRIVNTLNTPPADESGERKQSRDY